jgi:hypothetical protein
MGPAGTGKNPQDLSLFLPPPLSCFPLKKNEVKIE